MTQKEKVLALLKAAGRFGVRSDTYLGEHIPRAAARIRELREEGYEITSEREQRFVRYTLARGSAEGEGSAGDPAGHERAPGLCGRASEPQSFSAASSEAGVIASQSSDQGRPEVTGYVSPERSVPSMFDADVAW